MPKPTFIITAVMDVNDFANACSVMYRKNGRPLKAIKLAKLFYSDAIIATATGRSGNTTRPSMW